MVQVFWLQFSIFNFSIFQYFLFGTTTTVEELCRKHIYFVLDVVATTGATAIATTIAHHNVLLRDALGSALPRYYISRVESSFAGAAAAPVRCLLLLLQLLLLCFIDSVASVSKQQRENAAVVLLVWSYGLVFTLQSGCFLFFICPTEYVVPEPNLPPPRQNQSKSVNNDTSTFISACTWYGFVQALKT